MGRYDDIIALERPASSHPQMPRGERAKQFMPFASLRSFGGEIREKQEVLEERRIPGEDENAEKNAQAKKLMRVISTHPLVRALVFVPRVPGGSRGKYEEVEGSASRYDPVEGTLFLSGRKISLDDAFRIEVLEGNEAGEDGK